MSADKNLKAFMRKLGLQTCCMVNSQGRRASVILKIIKLKVEVVVESGSSDTQLWSLNILHFIASSRNSHQ